MEQTRILKLGGKKDNTLNHRMPWEKLELFVIMIKLIVA